ncbi:MAG: hypothetical protein NTV01_20410, partial [Bacteroidia bacterium]|nr:hypothetical protein [Bacteroidia bacterium]
DEMRRNMYSNWINVLTTVLKLYNNQSSTDLTAMNGLSLEELSKILTGTPGPKQFSTYILSDIQGNGRMPSNLFMSYLSSFILTKYCIDILLSPKPVRPTKIPLWFDNYKRLLRAYLVNSFGVTNPSPDQLNKVITQLPDRLITNNSYFNLDKTKFTIPMDVSLRQKKYEWVDCRIFPNDVSYQKLVSEIRNILKLPAPKVP